MLADTSLAVEPPFTSTVTVPTLPYIVRFSVSWKRAVRSDFALTATGFVAGRNPAAAVDVQAGS